MAVFQPTPSIRLASIPRFPYTLIGDDGSVWTCRVRGYPGLAGRWKRMGLCINGTGYYVIRLIDSDGMRHNCLVHRLVLEAFRGPAPTGMLGRHLDGVRTHNWLSNLAWGTHSENMLDRFRHARERAARENSVPIPCHA